MNDILKQLYNRFYTPLPMTEAEQKMEACRKQFIKRLEKPERKRMLRIMDAQSLMVEERSMDILPAGSNWRGNWHMN